MPEKTIREMTGTERRRHSLSARIMRATVLGTVILGLVALAIGLGLYTYAQIDRCVSDAYSMSSHAAVVLTQLDNFTGMADQVMEIYRSLTDEERAESGTDAYRERFSDIVMLGVYQAASNQLDTMMGTSDVSDTYVAVYDRVTEAMVYVIDPERDPQYVCMPGDWEALDRKEMDRFFNWDGQSRLYYFSYEKRYGLMCTSGVPVSDNGEYIVFISTDVTLQNLWNGIRSFLLQYVIAVILAMLVFSYFLSRRMRKTLIEPLDSITQAARNYAADKREGIRTTDHFASLGIHTGDEVENLSLVMADMERDLADYIDDLTKITAERERISTELSLAARIQADMLPNKFPPFPDRREFDIYASMTPAREVGGDFYDFFLTDEDHLGLVIADVSGKGIPAALFMMMSRILIRNYALTGRSPQEVVEAVNQQLCENNRERMFVTVWLGILEISTGRLTAVNAGHEYPILKSPGADFEIIEDTHGFVVGGMKRMKYKEYELQLQPGSLLFVYTDGVPEATDSSLQLFGMERTKQALNAARDNSPEGILQAVGDAVKAFAGEAEQYDDLTMLCIKYNEV